MTGNYLFHEFLDRLAQISASLGFVFIYYIQTYSSQRWFELIFIALSCLVALVILTT